MTMTTNTLKIGILGASGFIGKRTVEMLSLETTNEVRPIVRSSESVERLARPDLKSYIADALDEAALGAAFADCDVVIHAVVGNPLLIRKTISATYQAAQNAGVRRLVYLSTASVHGQSPSPGTDESSPLSDRQSLAYNNAKVQAERKLLELRANGSTEVVMLRPSIVFGPRDRWTTEFANALSAGTAYLVNEGKGICNSIYVDNLVHAIRLATTASDADGEAFLVSDRERVTWADLYRPIAEALGQDFSKIRNIDNPTFTPSLKDRIKETLRNSDLVQTSLSLIPNKSNQMAKGTAQKTLQQPALNQEMALLYQCQYKLPCQKAQKILGYEPIVSFSEACRRTIDWLTSTGYPVVPQRQ
jgi:nucleoside-diphosphate-sugar epimerase